MITLHALPGTEPWIPQRSALDKLSRHTVRDIHVYLRPRAGLESAWREGHPGQAPPDLGPYAFRAWAQPDRDRVTILVDRTEDPQSVLWVLAHELAHVELRTSPLVTTALGMTVRPRAYWTTDEGHQADPEERIADWIATRWMRLLGYPPPWRRDRIWWRHRVQSVTASSRPRTRHERHAP